MGIFTGDFVFVGSIGRPDLLETAAGVVGSAEVGARQLYHSTRRFRELSDHLQVWPAHRAGSACGKGLGAIPSSTVGYEKLFNPALQFEDEQEFVDYISLIVPRHMRFGRIEEGDVTLIDVRAATEFHAGHIARAEHRFLGTLLRNIEGVRKDKPVVAQCLAGGRSAIAASLLQRAGFDVVNMQGGYQAWVDAGLPVVRDDVAAVA
jgi:rhodanese-related sulfurtransferase